VNKDEIIRMAREAGFEHIAEANYWHPLFKRFAALVAAAEREECAKEIQSEICDEIEDEAYCILVALLARIRARGPE
jgi:hypothetical protein